MRQSIGTVALVLLITGAIDSIRNLPTTALFGSSLIFYFIIAAIMFLIPASLVSADLASTFTERSGVFAWVSYALGKPVGVIAIWLQWINTMVWYPTILSFIGGTATYLIDPSLAQNKFYLISVILIVFWSVTLINLKGLYVSTRFTSFCTVVGIIIPILFIIGLGAAWMVMQNPLQIKLGWSHFLPQWHQKQDWVALTAIMTAFLGMELATVHVNDVHEPQKTFPKALFVSVVLILATMIAGSLSIAIVLPHDTIDLVDGVMQAFAHFLSAYHLRFLTPVLTIMILVGSLGGMVNWIISPAKGLLHAGQEGYLPQWLSRENERGVASRVLILQAIIVSLICLAFLLMPSVNGVYWLLTDLSTEVYIMMYVLMFIAAIVLKWCHYMPASGFAIPGGRLGMLVTCLLGLLGCGTTLIVGFFPPKGIDVGSTLYYVGIFSTGITIMLAPVLLLFVYRAWYNAKYEMY